MVRKLITPVHIGIIIYANIVRNNKSIQGIGLCLSFLIRLSCIPAAVMLYVFCLGRVNGKPKALRQ